MSTPYAVLVVLCLAALYVNLRFWWRQGVRGWWLVFAGTPLGVYGAVIVTCGLLASHGVLS